MRLTVDVTGEATGLRRICKDDALTNRAGKHWRIVIRQRLGGVPGDDGARAAAVEQEAGDKFRPINAGLPKEGQHLDRGPAIEWRGLYRDQHQIGGEQR